MAKQRLVCYLDPDVVDRIDSYASVHRLSRSGAIGAGLTAGLPAVSRAVGGRSTRSAKHHGPALFPAAGAATALAPDDVLTRVGGALLRANPQLDHDTLVAMLNAELQQQWPDAPPGHVDLEAVADNLLESVQADRDLEALPGDVPPDNEPG